jgi:peptide/nickel transport system substrate-binding protein
MTEGVDVLVSMERRSWRDPRKPSAVDFEDRPGNWPVALQMAQYRTVTFAILLAAALTAASIGWFAFRRTPGAPPSEMSGRPAAGGGLVASLRGEPATYNRYVDDRAAGGVLAMLTQAPLVRVNRVTDELEAWLAESFTSSDDGLTYTIRLRKGVTFSDGMPLTSADVLFSFRALYDPGVNAVLALATKVSGTPLLVSAPDATTVIVRLPTPFAPGLRLIETLPILPRHKLQPALDSGGFAQAWGVGTPAGDMAGLGPFVLTEHVAGRHMVFSRNPHYWRKDASGIQLPYLDTLTILIIPDQNTEAVRLQTGETDLMSNADIRPEDYAAFKRLSDQGRLRLLDVGVGLDHNLLWFNLSPKHASDARNGWLRQKAFRQAVSCAVDRQAVVNAVYLGAAEPEFGPVTSANRTWYSPQKPACEYDPATARVLLASAGLQDRNGDGTLEDAAGAPARFSILTQGGHIRSRTVTVLQEQLRQVGLSVDVVLLDPGALVKRWTDEDYDSIYFGVQTSATDPALNPEFWFSAGHFHFWNPGQATPSTDWERRIDDLMRLQSAAPQLADRQRAFAEVQRILSDELPAIYFVAPRLTLAVSTRVTGTQPVPQIPQLLWSADTLAATGPRR